MENEYGYKYLYTLHLLDSDGKNWISGIIGSEYGKKTKIANPKNLWSLYFTSSKIIDKFREEHGDPDVIQVRRTFETAEQATDWESKVLRRIGAVKSDRWLNKANGGKEFFAVGPQSIETCQKKSIAMIGKNKGKKRSPEVVEQVAQKNRGRKRPNHSCAMKEKWDAADYRERTTTSMIQAANDPVIKQKKADAVRQAAKKPETNERLRNRPQCRRGEDNVSKRPDVREKIRLSKLDTIRITDGQANKTIHKSTPIPQGWRRGLTKKERV